MKRARPGIASTNRPRLGSFASLVDQILDDDSALDGLAFAYAGLEPPERQALTRAVLQDAGDPTQALLTFLTVEENPRLRQRLLGLVSRHGRVDQLAYLEGTETEGTAHLKQSIPGLEPEVLHVAWKDCEILHLHVEPRTGAHSESGEDSESGDDAVPIATVVQTLAPLLWQHIRSGGVLPTGIERFAGFFSVG